MGLEKKKQTHERLVFFFFFFFLFLFLSNQPLVKSWKWSVYEECKFKVWYSLRLLKNSGRKYFIRWVASVTHANEISRHTNPSSDCITLIHLELFKTRAHEDSGGCQLFAVNSPCISNDVCFKKVFRLWTWRYNALLLSPLTQIIASWL